MPVHDWMKVDAGIFHHFHLAWIDELQRALNGGLLPRDYYALAEQYAGAFEPDVLTLQHASGENGNGSGSLTPSSAQTETGNTLVLEEPRVRLVAEAEEFYRRKQKVVAVRHVSDDSLVAVIEIVSRGNKSGDRAMQAFVEKAAQLLEHEIHLLVVDLFPPGPRDPQGIHGAIWGYFSGQHYVPADSRPLTLASYESGGSVRAFVEHVGIGDALPAMPLYLRRRAHLPMPLEATYNAAFAAVPRRWRSVLEAGG